MALTRAGRVGHGGGLWRRQQQGHRADLQLRPERRRQQRARGVQCRRRRLHAELWAEPHPGQPRHAARRGACMIAALSGRKTYIAAALMLVKVVVDYVLGNGITLELLLEAL